jgi:4a-hydroxytetrahydrobiopterin dehydratase
MDRLAERRCEPCRADSTAVSADERADLLAELPGWEIQPEAGVPVLKKAFKFTNFVKALAFANGVGDLAEAEDHHPRLIVEWGRVEVAWWTHSIGGLHQNDFILAARCERLFVSKPG